MNIYNWKKDFNSKELSDGLELFKNGAVKNYSFNCDEFILNAAVIDNGEEYHPEIFIDSLSSYSDDDSLYMNNHISYFCDCDEPNSMDGCRHCAALMYDFDEKNGIYSKDKKPESFSDSLINIRKKITDYSIKRILGKDEPDMLNKIVNGFFDSFKKQLSHLLEKESYSNIFNLISYFYNNFPRSFSEKFADNSSELYSFCDSCIKNAFDFGDEDLKRKILTWISENKEFEYLKQYIE